MKNHILFANSILALIFGIILLAFYARFNNNPDVNTFVSPTLWTAFLLFGGIIFAGGGLLGILLSMAGISRNLNQ